MPGVSSTTLSGYHSYTMVRQNASGELLPVNAKVHCKKGAARIKSVDSQLARMDPGFMVPMPCFIFLVFDWLWVGWEVRMGKIRKGCLLMKMDSLRMSRLLTRHFCVPGMLVSTVLTLLSLTLSLLPLENPFSDVQEGESGQESVENGGPSGAVHVSFGSSTGPEAGEVHCAALACHRYCGRS